MTLAKLKGLGLKSQQMLENAGIHTFEQLDELGSIAVYCLVRQNEKKVSLNLLWALEGALLNQDWRWVARHCRTSLLLALAEYESTQYGKNSTRSL